VRDQSADNGNRVVAIPAGSSVESPRQDPEAGAAAAQAAPGDPAAAGPAIASAATVAAAAAVATAAAAESAAASAAAATASASAALAASQAGLATSAADSALPASSGDALSTLAGRSAARQARSPGSDGGPAPQVAAGASDSGTFRLEIPGTTSGAAPDGATSSPSPRPQGSGAAGAAQAASLQRGAREAGASAITLDWRSQAARPEPGPAVAEPGGGRSQAAMLLDAIHESRGATTGTATGDTPANAAGSFAGALALAGAPAAGGTAAAPEPARQENPWPVHDPAFVEHLAGQVSEALVGGIERAEITLNPRDLGPIRIELSLSGESASVAFSATQPETRTAIEQSLPILRDMLLEHGLALAHTSVQGGSADASGGGQSQRGPSDRAPTGGPSSQTSGGSAVAEPGARSTRAARGLLDLFA
jgi:flagellar hook-length control protein FliK